jgi:hypothetical protein
MDVPWQHLPEIFHEDPVSGISRHSTLAVAQQQLFSSFNNIKIAIEQSIHPIRYPPPPPSSRRRIARRVSITYMPMRQQRRIN